MGKVPVYEWLVDGDVYGVGTQAEFRKLRAEGVLPEDIEVGPIVAYQPAKRRSKALSA